MSWLRRWGVLALIGVVLLGARFAGAAAPAGALPYPTCTPAGVSPLDCNDTRLSWSQIGFDEEEIVLAPVGYGGAFILITMGELADVYQASSPVVRAAILSQLTPTQANRLIVAALYRQARYPQPVVQPIPANIGPIPTATPTPFNTAVATSTPVSGATATPVPACGSTAFVSDTNPPVGGSETVSGQLLCGGAPVIGASMTSTWDYPGFVQRCDGATTGVNGTASCTLVVPSVPSGTIVVINVSIAANNTNYGATASFVVK
jgi:hypothetical protein